MTPGSEAMTAGLTAKPTQKDLVAGALDRVFRKSPEGQVTLKHRSETCETWLHDLEQCLTFYESGVRVVQFLEEIGAEKMHRVFVRL